MAIKHETITVSGTVMYCDGCGKRGPESAYDNFDDTIDQAQMMGWLTGDDQDLCDECRPQEGERLPKKKRGKKR